MKKRLLITILVLSLAMTLVGCGGGGNKGGGSSDSGQKISLDEAREIAAKEFDFTPDDVLFIKLEKATVNGEKVYQTKFEKEGITYFVDVNEATGEVVSSDQK